MRVFKTAEEILHEIEKGQYNYYGLRSLTDRDIKALNSDRTYLDVSHVWEDGVDTGEDLPGTCAVYISDDMDETEIEYRYNRCYHTYQHLTEYGRVIALIADDRSEWGNDENEIILGSSGCGADIIGIVNLI